MVYKTSTAKCLIEDQSITFGKILYICRIIRTHASDKYRGPQSRQTFQHISMASPALQP
jgi:hypothetical protein